MQSQRNSLGSAYPQSPESGPVWAPPRSPLPPHRLAKLANALGVSTPLPAIAVSASLLSSSQSRLGNSPSPSHADPPWRSVTPSTTTALNLISPVQSKYLLHIIPPVHLPHEADISDTSEFATPPSTASGYHTQFRRGTLVALQSTLQAQLVVIAREYALPSTMGIVLYLVTTSQGRQNNSMHFPSPTVGDTGGGEPGPRLSEEIWKHIWTRVLRVEREEVMALPRSEAPNAFGLGLNVEPNGPSQSLRPLVTPTRTEQPRPLAYPITPSSISTTSSVSDTRSHEKSTSASSPHSEPNTPDTSRSSDHGPHDIELPGLNSPSIIPILAKVEFDIDRRKATWYEPWVRSRRMKRTESRSSHRSDSRSRTLDSSSLADEKRAPYYDLKLVQRMQKPPFLRSQDDSDEGEQLNDGEYECLSESPDVDAGACMTSTVGPDPLGDVFGTDAETWTEIHADSDGVRRKVNNPNVVELALDATSLTILPEQNQEEGGEAKDVAEVRDIIRRMSRPPLSVSIPNSAEYRRRSSPSTAVGKRPMPPPLVLVPKSPTNNLIEGITDVVDFRNKEGLSLELEREYQRSRSYGEEKRVGTVFEDLDLGLDLGDGDEEYDANDPNDRRRSQYLMKAKLDEIERTLAQFSPQQFKTAIQDEDSTITHRRNLSTASQSCTPASAESISSSPLHKAWPSVPYASMTKTVNGSPPRPANLPPSPPRLTLNGVSTGAPKAFMPTSGPSSSVPTESQVRRRELEQALYPVTMPSPSPQTNIASDSPIPLSPDPFGRHPSVYEVDAAPVQSYWDPMAQKLSHEPPLGSRPSMSSIDDGSGSLTSATPSSRFSADSSSVADQDDKATKSTAPLVSVKSLRKLWRRSKSTSGALTQPPTPGRTSFQPSSSPHPPTPTDQLTAPPIPGAITRGSNGKGHAGQLQSDQELPYPLQPSRPSLSGSRPNSPAVLLNAPPQEKSGIRKSILKTWKSVAGAGSQQPTNGSEPRKSSERPVSNETIKPRRPSVLDNSIPPSPQLPGQYLPSNHIRTGSNFLERRKSAARSKMGPGHHYSSASHDLLSTVPPARSSVIMQTPLSASPSQSQFSAFSRDSHAESRASLEMSQFEVVSSPKVHPRLTYPYITLDHE
ncbi:hypothetical protein J3R83DRAFT_6188 [Lanmaoa asiatica]|nr:hypothetical protein J3R83DRAFT_6188 [Lanmaoa asiatica]